MIRTLLATTALATLVATGAMAQETTNTNQMAPAPAATTEPAADATAVAPVTPAEGQLASNLIGETVYNGTGDDAENVGNVNDLVLSDAGQIEAIVIGVGGFLGIGEKNVAVNYSDIDWAERDGDRWIVIAATADSLRELPAFDRRAYEPMPAAGEGVASGTGTMAPAATDTTAQGTAGTMAPATPATDTATAPATTTMAPADTATAPATTAAPADNAAAPAATDTTTTAAVDRNTLTEVPMDQISAENLEGTTVYGADDANIGDIGDVILSSDGKVDAIVIDVGGFLGIGEKPVAVGMDNLKFMQDANGSRYLYTEFTKEQLDAQPAYDEANWTAQRDQMRMSVPN